MRFLSIIFGIIAIAACSDQGGVIRKTVTSPGTSQNNGNRMGVLSNENADAKGSNSKKTVDDDDEQPSDGVDGVDGGPTDGGGGGGAPEPAPEPDEGGGDEKLPKASTQASSLAGPLECGASIANAAEKACKSGDIRIRVGCFAQDDGNCADQYCRCEVVAGALKWGNCGNATKVGGKYIGQNGTMKASFCSAADKTWKITP